MHVLDYLKWAESIIQVDKQSNVRFDPRAGKDAVLFEYRLLCSGMFYPTNFLGDWSHSDGARILLSMPVHLLVASQPYDDYPQELSLRFVASMVHETDGRSSSMFYPDREIADDFAALLTILCRRLVTVSAKVREQHPDSHTTPILTNYPIPVVTTVKQSFWKPRPLSFLYGLNDVKVKSYHPPNLPFEFSEIVSTLLSLPKLQCGQSVIRAARLYAAAMERIESQPETCYQLFISAAETIANEALKDWEPDPGQKVASKNTLVDYAVKTEKLSNELAERLAMEACRGNPWSGRKFREFLLDYADWKKINEDDDLFIVPREFVPKDNEIEEALDDIYRTRSGASHGGKAFPASAEIGPSVYMPVRAFDDVANQRRPFPPIGWFERVVNSAICGFIKAQIQPLAETAGRPLEQQQATDPVK